MPADPSPFWLPDGPVPVERVIEMNPVIRQSLWARFNDCHLGGLFEMRAGRFSNPYAAAGTLFHSFAAEALRTMREQKETRIPPAEALEIMYEVAAQRDVEPWDRVVLPQQFWPHLRLCVLKFAKDMSFSVDMLVAIEERITVPLPYRMPDGSAGERLFSGQPDALLFDPPDGAVVIDFKTGRALPPEPRKALDEYTYMDSEKEALTRLSWEGYAQQRAYGMLVMRRYPSVQRVTLREVYVYRGVTREATIFRADLEHVEREIATDLEQLDRAVAAGPRFAGTGLPRDPWPASPGRSCSWCSGANRCPIEATARSYKAIASPEEAERAAAEFHVADGVRATTRKALKEYCEVTGELIPVRNAKGRKVMGFNVKSDGSQSFGVFTPEGSDRSSSPDPRMEEAFLRAAEDATRGRARERRARKTSGRS